MHWAPSVHSVMASIIDSCNPFGFSYAFGIRSGHERRRRECTEGGEARGEAFTEFFTHRIQHEFIGDGQNKLTNNKSKGLKAQTQGILQMAGAGSGATRS